MIQHAAVALLALAVDRGPDHWRWDPGRAGPVGPAAVASVGLGVAAFVLAVMVAFPALSQDEQFGRTGIGPAITVGVLALGILALSPWAGSGVRSVVRSRPSSVRPRCRAGPEPEPAPGS